MDHPHLLPNEIDLLVDGQSGAAVAPLRAHLAECESCLERYEALHVVGNALDALPHFAPHSRLANSVMAKVQVTEPWHLALADSALRLVPSGTPLRVLLGLGVGLVAAAISGSVLWLVFRADLATWAMNLVLDRGREQLAVGVNRLLVLIGALVMACIGSALVFRRLAQTARAHRG